MRPCLRQMEHPTAARLIITAKELITQVSLTAKCGQVSAGMPRIAKHALRRIV
jgi:hypothetical protein